jgi:hypothetical protein
VRIYNTVIIILYASLLVTGCATGPILVNPPGIGGKGIHTLHKNSPLAQNASYFLDPRAGIALNSGYRLSGAERTRMYIPLIGFLLVPSQAMEAATGVTETEYCYNNRLGSLAGQKDIDLALYLHRKGKLTDKEFDAYIGHVLSRYLLPAPSSLQYIKNHRNVAISTQGGKSYLEHWPDFYGPTPDMCRLLLQKKVITKNNLLQFLRQRTAGDYTLPAQPNYIINAEQYGILDKKEADRQLKKRFWTLYKWALNNREMTNRFYGDEKQSEQIKITMEKAMVIIRLGEVPGK